jgi:hypothetical protein
MSAIIRIQPAAAAAAALTSGTLSRDVKPGGGLIRAENNDPTRLTSRGRRELPPFGLGIFR